MARRRGNNEGTIHKREDGTWRAQVTLDGQRLSYSAKSRQECQGWLKGVVKQIDTSLSYTGANMKFGEYLNLWMKTVQENRRQKTYIQYEGLLRLYIRPAFGEYRLRDLQPIKIENYLNQKKTEGVGERTCQLIYSTMHTSLNAAVRKGLIGRNPMDAVEKPKVKNPRPKVTLEPEQVQQLLIAAQGHRNQALNHLAVVTGLREGEILALEWNDLDWVKRRMKIQRQAYRIPKQGMVYSSPKTQSGIRTIMLGQVTIDKLKEHQERQQLEKAAAGDRWQENGLMFPTVIGTLSDPHNLLKEFKELLEKAYLPKMRFHDLRHTSITLVLNDIGAPIKEAQRRAGHASPSTTINLYGGEATNKMDDLVAQSLDELVTPLRIELPQAGPTNDRLVEK